MRVCVYVRHYRQEVFEEQHPLCLELAQERRRLRDGEVEPRARHLRRPGGS